MLKTIINDTVRFNWIDSGTSVTSMSWILNSGSETVVNTGTFTSSGNGHYYADVSLPNTPGFWRIKAQGYAEGNLYVRSEKVRTVLDEVD